MCGLLLLVLCYFCYSSHQFRITLQNMKNLSKVLLMSYCQDLKLQHRALLLYHGIVLQMYHLAGCRFVHQSKLTYRFDRKELIKAAESLFSLSNKALWCEMLVHTRKHLFVVVYGCRFGLRNQ